MNLMQVICIKKVIDLSRTVLSAQPTVHVHVHKKLKVSITIARQSKGFANQFIAEAYEVFDRLILIHTYTVHYTCRAMHECLHAQYSVHTQGRIQDFRKEGARPSRAAKLRQLVIFMSHFITVRSNV